MNCMIFKQCNYLLKFTHIKKNCLYKIFSLNIISINVLLWQPEISSLLKILIFFLKKSK